MKRYTEISWCVLFFSQIHHVFCIKILISVLLDEVKENKCLEYSGAVCSSQIQVYWPFKKVTQSCIYIVILRNLWNFLKGKNTQNLNAFLIICTYLQLLLCTLLWIERCCSDTSREQPVWTAHCLWVTLTDSSNAKGSCLCHITHICCSKSLYSLAKLQVW